MTGPPELPCISSVHTQNAPMCHKPSLCACQAGFKQNIFGAESSYGHLHEYTRHWEITMKNWEFDNQ